MKKFKCVVFVCIAFVCTEKFVLATTNNDGKKVITFNSWTVFKSPAGEHYAVSYPIKISGNYGNRKVPYLLVKIVDNKLHFIYNAGYHQKQNTNSFLEILLQSDIKMGTYDVKGYYLLTEEDSAWVLKKEKESQLIDDLCRGTEVLLRAQSTIDTYSNDVFLLSGFCATKRFLLSQIK